jgi:broad specificity phosphatase PhoE
MARAPGGEASPPGAGRVSARRLILVRHGRVDFDSGQFVDTPLGRQWDPPLDAVGLDQAERLGPRLAEGPAPATILVSPLTRCRQTLAPYERISGARPEVVDGIREVFTGRWEGMRFEDILSEDEEIARKFRDQEATFSMSPGGESGEQLRARVVPAIDGALAGTGGDVLAVTHGGVINAYLGHLMGVAHDMFYLPENTSLNTVTVDGDRREMRFLNDVRHLTDPPPPASGDPPGRA